MSINTIQSPQISLLVYDSLSHYFFIQHLQQFLEDLLLYFFLFSNQQFIFLYLIFMHSRDKKIQNYGSPIYREQLDFQQDEAASEEGIDFEKTNQIFVLNSKINELNFFIQKMALQNEQKLLQERNLLQQMKKQHQMRYQSLQLQCQKAKTIAQAQKTAKGISNKQMKSLKNELQEARRILEMPLETTSEHFLYQLTKKQKQAKEIFKKYQQLQSEVLKLKNRFEEKEKDIIKQSQQNIKSQSQKYRYKLEQGQQEKKKYLSQIQQKTASIDQCLTKIGILQHYESQYRKTVKKLQQQQALCAKKQEQLSSLRVKQQLFSITKQKYQEGKVKLDEYIEEMTFKLGLQRKKLEMVEIRLLEQKEKSSKLQFTISNYKQQLRNSQERIVALEESIHQLQQKLNVSNVYKEKQKISLSNISQLQENNRQLSHNLQEYAEKYQILQGQLHKAEETRQNLQKIAKRNEIQIQQKAKEISVLNLKINHQSEITKEMKLQLIKTKQELQQTKKEKSSKNSINLVETHHTSCQNHSNSDRQIWQRMNQEIVSHYQKILDSQDKTRLQLQQQLQHLNKSMCQMRQELAEEKKEINQLKQQRQLLEKQNKRLIEAIASINKVHQKRVIQIKEKFKDIKEGSQIHKLLSSKSQKNMNILNCYSFCQQTSTSNLIASPKIQINSLDKKDLEDPKDAKDKGRQEISAENVRKKLVKYSSSDNFTDNYRSTQTGFEQRSCDLDASIKLYRERNNSMRVQLNI